MWTMWGDSPTSCARRRHVICGPCSYESSDNMWAIIVNSNGSEVEISRNTAGCTISADQILIWAEYPEEE